MIDPGKGKYFITEEGKIKFNIHSNFCGRKDCVNFGSCGQALRDIDKHRLIDKGLVPIIDIHGYATCYSTEPKEKPEGKLVVDNTPDWPAQMITKEETDDV